MCRLYCDHDIIWRTVHRKKFTHEEEELIDQFLLNAAHELDKAGFKMFAASMAPSAAPAPINV